MRDFRALNATYSIFPDNATIRVPITVLADAIDENTEVLSASLSISPGFEDQVTLGSNSSAEVDIIDGDSMLLQKVVFFNGL